jgi:hypothetical protein
MCQAQKVCIPRTSVLARLLASFALLFFRFSLKTQLNVLREPLLKTGTDLDYVANPSQVINTPSGSYASLTPMHSTLFFQLEPKK